MEECHIRDIPHQATRTITHDDLLIHTAGRPAPAPPCLPELCKKLEKEKGRSVGGNCRGKSWRVTLPSLRFDRQD
ncbi:hypothetical protein RvY_18518 [Ramazzottius varieornatus]|uniref:Uncharacterized protein n=1 Tax=Ramazzottius varieornatus TaxID=947166 RepID=A0A1D1W622_RAMVA|nr:hypothetical protein RvY_18518 [Ramazzottius varieornatus]